MQWLSTDTETDILQRLDEALTTPSNSEENIKLTIKAEADLQTAYALSGYNHPLRSLSFLRLAGSGGIPSSLSSSLWQKFEASLPTLRHLRCSDGGSHLWDAGVLNKLKMLQSLNLSNCDMLALPAAIKSLTSLTELRVVGNKLKLLPPEIGHLSRLKVLAADNNELALLPGELRRCSDLEELTLENNRLTSVLLAFQALPRLKRLQLYNNPLEFLPEIAPCRELRNLSVANLRISSDEVYSKFQVEVLPSSGTSTGTLNITLFESKPQDRLKPLFTLMMRRSTGHHPLLAGALKHLAEDVKTRDSMAKQEGALQQLILLALNDNEVVVEQACATLSLLARHSEAFAQAVVDNESGSLLRLVQRGGDAMMHIGSLQVLSAIALSSSTAATRLFNDDFAKTLSNVITSSSAPIAERTAALEALGNLAFSPEVRKRLDRQHGLMNTVSHLAQSSGSAQNEANLLLRAAAIRVLAALGENDEVDAAVGKRPLAGKGPRILSLDGGGMKGLATVRLLREIESRMGGRPLAEMFDLIVGTSTGAMIAVALGLKRMSLDDCEALYKVLGQRVFTKPIASRDKEESWMESFVRTFHTKTQHVRAVVVGCKHDASIYEVLLKENCDFTASGQCLSNAMIDTACLNAPKIALVSTLASLTPAAPFVFRNYEFPVAAAPLLAQAPAHRGSAKHEVWQAVRASSAATYYLDEFLCNGDKFQDGAVTANNPAIVALHEARLLWPELQPELLVSIGTGNTPQVKRPGAMSSYMDTGSILIESATSVERVDEALSTILPMVPGLRYFRFCPQDERCGMELDEIDPAAWERLEAATDEFTKKAAIIERFDAAAAALLAQKYNQVNKKVLGMFSAAIPADQISVGLRRKMMVLNAPHAGTILSAEGAVAAKCGQRLDCVSTLEIPFLSMEGAIMVDEGLVEEEDVSAELSRGGTTEIQSTGDDDEQGTLASLMGWFSPTKGPSHPSTSPPSVPKPLMAHPIASLKKEGLPAMLPPRRNSVSNEVALLVEATLEGAKSVAGVLHLGLKAAGEDGLVLQWQQKVQAFVEPSSEASRLITQVQKSESVKTLGEMFELHRTIATNKGGVMSMLSRQSVVTGGKQVSMYLVQETSPAVVLDVELVNALAHVFSGLVIVSASPVPKSLMSALLRAGAKGIVCPSNELPSWLKPRVAVDFFEEFYDRLFHGETVTRALHATQADHKLENLGLALQAA